ncbi:MAG: nitroreductase family protein [Alsobacter sp.]
MDTTPARLPDHPVDPIFLKRWSPRGFTDEEIPEAVLNQLFEAARWAPSASNLQPWRFIYARRGGPGWDAILSTLVPFNQGWAHRAAALVVVVSKRTTETTGGGEPKPSHSHSFDAGAAWGYLALQAAHLGWVAHGMTGFDTAKAQELLGVPADYRVEAAIAIGRHGNVERLPDTLQARETPSTRRPVASFAFEGRFPPA